MRALNCLRSIAFRIRSGCSQRELVRTCGKKTSPGSVRKLRPEKPPLAWKCSLGATLPCSRCCQLCSRLGIYGYSRRHLSSFRCAASILEKRSPSSKRRKKVSQAQITSHPATIAGSASCAAILTASVGASSELCVCTYEQRRSPSHPHTVRSNSTFLFSTVLLLRHGSIRRRKRGKEEYRRVRS